MDSDRNVMNAGQEESAACPSAAEIYCRKAFPTAFFLQILFLLILPFFLYGLLNLQEVLPLFWSLFLGMIPFPLFSTLLLTYLALKLDKGTFAEQLCLKADPKTFSVSWILQ